MIFLSKVFKESKRIKLPFLNICGLKISDLYTVEGFVQSKLYCTIEDENKVLPLLEIQNLNPKVLDCDAGKLTVLVKEVLNAKASGKLLLPEYIKIRDVRDILEDCHTPTQRNKYLKFLFIKEKKRQKDVENKIRKKTESENPRVKDLVDTDHIQYGLGKNTLILRTWKRSVLKFYEKRMANSLLFGQNIVLDLGYDELMIKREKATCASQIALLYSMNRLSQNPFNLYFCNANAKSRCLRYLKERIPNLDKTFATVTPQSYLELFPKQELVYLSPHATEALTTYDHKAVYIIGAFVDTVKKVVVSTVKAQEEGIKSYSLPLDEYTVWGSGSKSLTINQVFAIMQTFRDTGDWREALKHVPTRKLKQMDSNTEEKEFSAEKLCVLSSN